jgi:hypothetical protein
MPKFQVEIDETWTSTVKVTAEDEAEAIHLVSGGRGEEVSFEKVDWVPADEWRIKPMKKYEVSCREVWLSVIEVYATSEEHAIELVEDGEGEERCFEKLDTYPSTGWTARLVDRGVV